MTPSVMPIPSLVAQKAVEQLSEYLSDHCHTIYRGLKRDENGRLTDKQVIVCQVQQKLEPAVARAQGLPVFPHTVKVDGYEMEVEVVQKVQPKDMKLAWDSKLLSAHAKQHCFVCPIPGGAQMAPEGANWVGTIGSAFTFPLNGKEVHGAVTCYHVAMKKNAKIGDKMLQPGPGYDWFGKLARWCPLNFSGPNYLDIALIDCRRTDGQYAPVTDTVGPHQVDLGAYVPAPILNPPLGQRVVKVGRTTGVTLGILVGVGASSRVQYDGGVATFIDQFVFETEDGTPFSEPGDSGSMIMTEDMRPVGSLFAGGGSTTLANPLKYLLEWSGGRFFGQK